MIRVFAPRGVCATTTTRPSKLAEGDEPGFAVVVPGVLERDARSGEYAGSIVKAQASGDQIFLAFLFVPLEHNPDPGGLTTNIPTTDRAAQFLVSTPRGVNLYD